MGIQKPMDQTRSAAGSPESRQQAADLIARAARLREDEDFAEAERLLLQAGRLDPLNGAMLHEFGLIQFARARYADAQTFFKRAVRARPDDAEVQYDLGRAYAAASQTEKAIAAFEAALALDPGHSGAKGALLPLRSTEPAAFGPVGTMAQFAPLDTPASPAPEIVPPFAAVGSFNEPDQTFPAVLNLGSGKDFRADCFNIDIDDTWAPDAIVDLSGVDLDESGIVLPTYRFGDVTLRPGCFQRIITNDVLEHVPNLMKFMTTCLKLLRLDGVFEISVPYDLSFGAWQDPTHVRAFNERSWLYYTEWFWYMGWGECRFTADLMQFVLSPYGHELAKKGVAQAEITRTPRAVDSMSVHLRKIRLTEKDRQTWQYWRERREEAAKRSAGLRGRVAGASRPPVATAPHDRGASQVPGAESGHASSGSEPSRSDPLLPTASAARPDVTSFASGAPLPPFPDGWEAHRDRHCIWIVSPDGYVHNRAFFDVAKGLSEAFAELGGSAPLTRSPNEWHGRVPIVFGGNLLDRLSASTLPPGSVIYNLEQAQNGSAWMNETYLSLLRRFPVLDYSIRNRQALAGLGIHATLLPVGYADGLTRVRHRPRKDIDILFYGSQNERRKKVLDALTDCGFKVVSLFGAYGTERDDAIGRSRIILNMHYYEAAIFEVVRVSYLLANGVCVVTEGSPEDPDLLPFADGMAIAPIDGLVDRCVRLLADDRARERVAARGFAAMKRRRQSSLLAHLFAPAGEPGRGMGLAVPELSR